MSKKGLLGKASIEVSQLKKGKFSDRRVLAWSLFIFIGSLTVYIGYGSTLSESVQNRSPITNQEAQAVSVNTVPNPNNHNEKDLGLKDAPYPVNGNVLRGIGNYYSESFGDYRFHAGVDYAVLEGTVIRATQGGKVTFSGWDPLLGQKVTLDCGEGWSVTYGGLDNLRVKVGETVEAHDALGQVGLYPGAEGVRNQPQLHYELWYENEVQSP